MVICPTVLAAPFGRRRSVPAPVVARIAVVVPLWKIGEVMLVSALIVPGVEMLPDTESAPVTDPVMTGLASVLLVRVWVPPTVTTEVASVPDAAILRSPPATVSTFGRVGDGDVASEEIEHAAIGNEDIRPSRTRRAERRAVVGGWLDRGIEGVAVRRPGEGQGIGRMRDLDVAGIEVDDSAGREEQVGPCGADGSKLRAVIDRRFDAGIERIAVGRAAEGQEIGGMGDGDVAAPKLTTPPDARKRSDQPVPDAPSAAPSSVTGVEAPLVTMPMVAMVPAAMTLPILSTVNLRNAANLQIQAASTRPPTRHW